MKKEKLISIILYALVTVTAFFLLSSAVGFRRDSPSTKNITYINTALVRIGGGTWEERALPCILSGLQPETPVSLAATVYPKPEEGIFIQSDYAMADIYFDGALSFQMGKEGNYPCFMKSPGREVHIVEASGDGSGVELRIDYHSPKQGGALTLYKPMVGSAKEILMERGERYGLSMLLSVVQVVSGIAMMLVSIYVGLIDRKGLLFLWLGLFSMLTGLWFLGDNAAAVAVFPQTALLYFASFIGLFSSPIVLFRFVRESVEFENPRVIWGMEHFFSLSALIVLFLQMTGAVPFYRSVLPFFLVLILGILLLNLFVIREYRLTRSIDAKRFPLPIGAILISGIFGLLSLLFPLNDVFPMLHQSAILLFLLIIGVFVGVYVKDSLDLQQQMTRLSYEEKLIHIQNDEQKEHAAQLVKNEEALRRQRHDLRHHLTMLQELAGDNERLQNYLSTLETRIPKRRELFCENSVVNAVVSHYASRCEQEGIRLTVRLAVPETGEESTDSDLCTIFSNLLENAAEACGRMEEGEKFIRLSSTLKHRLLTIVMDNSFNGEVTKFGERFRSAKRNDYGVGLASVQSIAKEAHGDAVFKAEDRVFCSSVYFMI